MKSYAELALELFDIMDPEKRRPPSRDVSKLMHGEMAVMRLLDAEENALLAGEISKKLSMSTSRVAAVLGSLEKKALIERQTDPQDKRRVAVHITQAGRAFNAQKREHVIAHMQRMLEQLGENDAAEYVRLTRRALEIMHKEGFHEEKPDESGDEPEQRG